LSRMWKTFLSRAKQDATPFGYGIWKTGLKSYNLYFRRSLPQMATLNPSTQGIRDVAYFRLGIVLMPREHDGQSAVSGRSFYFKESS
jgi:hypothetical protein